MARLINGILGGLRGRIGNVEGYQLNGQWIVRTRRKKTSMPPSEKQLATRQAMQVVNRFLGACAPFVKVGYKWVAQGSKAPAYSRAVAWQMKYALTGIYPDISIDYSKVLLSKGTLKQSGLSPSVQLQGNKLVFIWEPSFMQGNEHVMLLAYCLDLHAAVYELCGAKRITGTAVLMIPEYWQGKRVETYISFVEENGTRCMDSVYTGSVVITDF